jgi:hypothetical protein
MSKSQQAHAQKRTPRAKVSSPRRARKAWCKSTSTPCVLKPGTEAWERLWPQLTDPDAVDCAASLLQRPKTRAECKGGPRPCPWVSCSFHRYLSVNPNNGAIWLNCPDVLPWEMEDSCLLDLVESGEGLTLAEVGRLQHLSKERMRQVEKVSLEKLRDNLGLDRLREVYENDGDF